MYLIHIMSGPKSVAKKGLHKPGGQFFEFQYSRGKDLRAHFKYESCKYRVVLSGSSLFNLNLGWGHAHKGHGGFFKPESSRSRLSEGQLNKDEAS